MSDLAWSQISLSGGRSGYVLLLACVFLLGAVLLSGQWFLIAFARKRNQSADHESRQEKERLAAALESQHVTSLRNDALAAEVRERQKAEARLQHLAYHDPMTGLYNRAYLSERMQQYLQTRPVRKGAQAALLYLDLDNFKAVNDTLGHGAGDRLLVEIAARIQRCVGVESVVARMGGDEFTVLLQRVYNSDSAYRLAQRLITLIEEPLEVEGNLFTISASVGVCGVHEGYTQGDMILRDADLALYRAKRDGGSRAVIFSPSIYEEMLLSTRTKQEMKDALSNQEYEVYYQPLIDMRDNTIYGVEALIRWNHPRRGLLTPGNFIPLAEETGLVVEIGNWCLRKACEEYGHMLDHAENNLLLSVNVSTRQLESGDFVETLREVLQKSVLRASCLQLEITESILASDPVRVGALFQEIRALGVKIAFDDFGTGYSSLSYLERYPIDTLKIDQSFVQGMKGAPVNRDIVRFIVQLAHAIHTRVTAEGVETSEQQEMLLSLGCFTAQGFLYSRPVPLAATLQLLEQGLPGGRRESRAKLFRLPARPEPV
ncbi:MAG: EAL domain-containing protein [Acidobacteriaceae bacterium]|nr:EAL domain-containing protein [Acidobacteriaceae bacterium]